MLGLGRTMRLTVALVAGLIGSGFATSGASGATCVSTASFEWDGVGSGLWSCGKGSAADHYVVAAGHTVRVTGDVVQAASSGIGIHVVAGGEFRVEAESAALHLILGGEGLDCAPGSRCVLRGRYRQMMSTPGFTTDVLEDGAIVHAGSILLCEPDGCESSPHRVRVRWPGGGGREAPEVSLVDAGDILCWADSDPGDLRVGADSGHCYDVLGTGTDGQSRWIDFDVRQGRFDQSGFPLSRRLIARGMLARSVEERDRLVRLRPASTIDADGRHVGRWLRFGTPDGTAAGSAYKILATVNGDSEDTVTLGSLLGSRSSHAAGSPVWVDYGWEPGDEMFVEVPVIVGSATPASTNLRDSRVKLRGEVALRAVSIREVIGVLLEDAKVTEWQDVWIRDYGDHDGPNGEMAIRMNGVHDATLERTLLTGGSPTPAKDKTHGIGMFGCQRITITDLTTRHLGDDVVVSDGFQSSNEIALERVHAAFRSDNARSQQLFDPSSRSVEATLKDAICDDCTDSDVAIGGHDATGSAELLVEGVLSWGADGPVAGALSDKIQFRDLVVIGSQASTPGVFVPKNVEGFEVREVRNVSPSPAAAIAAGFGRLKDGIVLDATLASSNSTALSAGPEGALENVLLADVHTSGACDSGSCRLVLLPGGGAQRASRMTIAWTRGESAAYLRGITLYSGASYAGGYVGGLLLAGLSASGSIAFDVPPAALVGPLAPVLSPLCFWGNAISALPTAVPLLPAGSLFDVMPDFVAPELGRFDVPADSAHAEVPCGIGSGLAGPGVSRYRWLHAKSKLAPMRFGADSDSDGVIESAHGMPCTGGGRDECVDNCPGVFNPEQEDADGDSMGDACDSCPSVASAELSSADSDGDGWGDACDVCIEVWDPDQRDDDHDGYGNFCDADFDGDGIVNFRDLAWFKSRFFSGDPVADLTGDGVVNFADLERLRAGFLKAPGPSAVAK